MRIPDWVHSILYIAIMAIIMVITAYYTENIIAVIFSLVVGHIFASAIIRFLPGFWGD